MSNQPSHSVPSQKGKDVNKDINTLPLAPSQKGVSIEKVPQPGTHDKEKDTSHIPPKPKIFQRRKKTTNEGSQGAHTVVQSLSSSFTEPILNSVVDVSPANVEKQPHSLSIPPPTPHSHSFSEIAMIDNQAFSNSPSLQFREEPILQTINSPSYESSFLDLLNTDSPTIEKLIKLFTSTDNITSIDNIPITDIISSTDTLSSTDIYHPLIIPTKSMDIYHSMNIPFPSDLIVQILLGLREGSDLLSEGA